MDVRRARIEDAEELGHGLKVVVDEERWVATENPVSVEELAARVRQRFVEGQTQFVLEDEGAPVGILSLRPTRVEGVLSLGMWILPGHRARAAAGR